MSVFISYRRRDTKDNALAIQARLEKLLPATKVLLDLADLRDAGQFREEIKKQLKASEIVLVLVGAKWTPGHLARKMDVVRLELEYAREQGLTVIPVAINDVQFPEIKSPKALTDLFAWQGFRVRFDDSFGDGVAKLSKAIERELARRQHEREQLKNERSRALQNQSFAELSRTLDSAAAAKQIALRLITDTEKLAEEYDNAHARELLRANLPLRREALGIDVASKVRLGRQTLDSELAREARLRKEALASVIARKVQGVLGQLEKDEPLSRVALGFVGEAWSEANERGVIAATPRRLLYAVSQRSGDSLTVVSIDFSNGRSLVEDWYERRGVLLRKHVLGATFEIHKRPDSSLKVWVVDSEFLQGVCADWSKHQRLGLEKFRRTRESR